MIFNLTIARKLSAFSLVSLAFVLVMAGTGGWAIAQLTQSANEITVSSAAIEVIENSRCVSDSIPSVSSTSWNTPTTAPRP